jgi:hypothetical protein
MLALTLTLILSQTPPAAPAELLQRFETERPVVLQALAAKYACEKPSGKLEPLCDAALSATRGTAADIRGQNVLVGLTWVVRRGQAGKVTVSAPRLSALALNENGARVLGAVSDISPENAKEKKLFARLAKDYEALLEGRKTNVTLPETLRSLLSVWSKSANHPLEKRSDAWLFKGAPGELRKVGDHWVLVGLGRAGDEIGVSVFTP